LPDLGTLKVKILEEFETRYQRSVDEHGTLAVKCNQHKADKPTKKSKADKETYNSKKSTNSNVSNVTR